MTRNSFAVRVTPRAGVDSVDGVTDDGQLHVRVRAAPADGAANKAVLKLLAKVLDVPQSSLELVSGATSRTKRIAVAGVDRATLAGLWPALRIGGDER